MLGHVVCVRACVHACVCFKRLTDCFPGGLAHFAFPGANEACELECSTCLSALGIVRSFSFQLLSQAVKICIPLISKVVGRLSVPSVCLLW